MTRKTIWPPHAVNHPLREEHMINIIYKFGWDESGVSAVEYAILVALCSILVLASIHYFFTAVRDLFFRVANDLPS